MMRNSCRCHTVLGLRHIFVSVVGWLLGVGMVLTVFVLGGNPYIHGDKSVLARFIVVLVSSLAIYIRLSGLQRIIPLFYRLRKLPVGGRIASLVILVTMPPVLEFIALFKIRKRGYAPVLPNFWCDAPETGFDARKLADGVREKYFVTVDCKESPELLICTNKGMVILLIRDFSLYLFLLVGENEDLPMNVILPPNSKWCLEVSEDGYSGALVSEVYFAPCTADESKAAEVVIALLGELSEIREGC